MIYVHEVRSLLRVSNFRTPARPAGFENFWLWWWRSCPAAGYALAARGVDTRTLQAFMGHRSIANTVVYTAVADKRIRNIWGK
jgi:integrase